MAVISFFETELHEQKYFRSMLKGHTLRFDKKPFSKRNASKHKDADVLVVFVMSIVDAESIDQLSKLKAIVTMSTGFDHIDVEAAKRHKVKVCNVPSYGSNTVAEFAFSMLLALERNIVPAVGRTRQGIFDFKGLMGRDLFGRTLGVMGTGKIGLHMIQYAKAFGMQVVAYDAYPRREDAKKMGFTYVTKEKLCKVSDIISLHLPLLPQTEHVLSTKEFSVMKKGVRIINTGRGPLINTTALIRALDKKIVGGVALDVLEGEKDFKKEARLCYRNCSPLSDAQLKLLVKNHDLMHRENVLVTPHLAFYSEEALKRIMDTTIGNVKGALSGKYKNKIA